MKRKHRAKIAIPIIATTEDDTVIPPTLTIFAILVSFLTESDTLVSTLPSVSVNTLTTFDESYN